MPIDLARIDRAIAGLMRRTGVPALRISLAVVFVWFGLLKPLGLSPAAELVRQTVAWMPVLSPDGWLAAIGWWEVLIGATFLSRRTVRIAIALLAMQMVGTFLPLVILPEVVFQPGRAPWGLTLEGQYIVKNILIISAALVVGGTVRGERSADDATAAAGPVPSAPVVRDLPPERREPPDAFGTR